MSMRQDSYRSDVVARFAPTPGSSCEHCTNSGPGLPLKLVVSLRRSFGQCRCTHYNEDGGTGEGGGSCSILARRDETLLRLDHFDIERAIERRRKWFARTPRPPDGAEPILQTRRRDEPE